jgi:hypothetical protein
MAKLKRMVWGRAALGGLVLAAALAGCAPSGAVVPTITFAGLDPADATQLTASGRVEGISESGGLCSFTFWAVTGAATRLTGEGKAAGDHTDCGPVSEAVGFFVGVTYSVELKYAPVSGEAVTSERVPMVLPSPGDLNPR